MPPDHFIRIAWPHTVGNEDFIDAFQEPFFQIFLIPSNYISGHRRHHQHHQSRPQRSGLQRRLEVHALGVVCRSSTNISTVIKPAGDSTTSTTFTYTGLHDRGKGPLYLGRIRLLEHWQSIDGLLSEAAFMQDAWNSTPAMWCHVLLRPLFAKNGYHS